LVLRPASRGSLAFLVRGGSGATRDPCGIAQTAPSLIAAPYGSARLAQAPTPTPRFPALDIVRFDAGGRVALSRSLMPGEAVVPGTDRAPRRIQRAEAGARLRTLVRWRGSAVKTRRAKRERNAV